MAIIRVKPNTLHADRTPIQPAKPTRKPRPLTIAESYARHTGMTRLPQNKAGQS